MFATSTLTACATVWSSSFISRTISRLVRRSMSLVFGFACSVSGLMRNSRGVRTSSSNSRGSWMTPDDHPWRRAREKLQKLVNVVLEDRDVLRAKVFTNNVALPVQDVGFRYTSAYIVATQRLGVIHHPDGVVDPVFFHERCNRGSAARIPVRHQGVNRNTNDLEPAASIFLLQGHKPGDLHSARPAPGCPEVQNHNLPLIRFEAVFDICGDKRCSVNRYVPVPFLDAAGQSHGNDQRHRCDIHAAVSR